jgi:histidinol-phosphate aminotransferase
MAARSTDVRFIDHCCDGIRQLRPYEAGKPIAEIEREFGLSGVIKLASNENPLGPSPRALAAMRAELDGIALYPDGNAFALKAALARKHGIGPERITVGSGSDHLLELVARAFLGPGRSAAISRYAFAIYAIVTQGASAELRVAEALAPSHPTQPYGHDLDAMLAKVDASTRVVFIANPNNPTGTWLDRAALERFMTKVPPSTLVLVDEAYVEYVQEPDYPDCSQWLDRFPNLIVTRTFSKAYGLAGVRVGYALASAELTDLINRVRLAFNPNSLGQSGAVAALDDADHLRRTLEANRAGMAQLAAGFDRLGLPRIPSVCNFHTVDVGRPGREVFQALLREGVIVRPVDNYGLTNHLRISVGTAAQNDRLLAALAKVLGQAGPA